MCDPTKWDVRGMSRGVMSSILSVPENMMVRRYSIIKLEFVGFFLPSIRIYPYIIETIH